MIPILYEDNALLVCLKPPALLSQAGQNGGEALLSLLEAEGHGAVFPVHRLDRGVGGLMVVAKTQRAAASLSAAVQARVLEKTYLCVVRGQPSAEEGIYRDLLLHDRARNKSFVVDRMRGGVKEAVLSYRVLARRAEDALVQVQLHTGRTHQIRVQFSSRGTPLLGDGKYGGGSGDIALWSCALAFPHPKTGRTMSFRQLPAGDPWDGFPLTELVK